MLEALHERLALVSIKCLPFGEFMARYDQPKTLFYLDPPYSGCENDYGKNVFEPEDFTALSKQLKTIKDDFIMSIDDADEIGELFA